MFSSTPSILIYLKRDSVLLFDGKTTKKLSLPVDTVADLEVIDKTKLSLLCDQFFADKNIRNKRVLMVLDRSVVFDKTVPLSAKADFTPFAEAFRASIPLEADKNQLLVIHDNEKLFLYATNRPYYETIYASLLHLNAKVMAITPIAAYKVTASTSDKQLSQILLHDTATAKHVSFIEK